MTAITLTPQETTGAAARASRAGFVTDLLLVAGRASAASVGSPSSSPRPS